MPDPQTRQLVVKPPNNEQILRLFSLVSIGFIRIFPHSLLVSFLWAEARQLSFQPCPTLMIVYHQDQLPPKSV